MQPLSRPARCLVILAALLVAPAVSALGLGEISVRSRLNQPLDIRVPLLRVTADEADTAQVLVRPAAPVAMGSTIDRIRDDFRYRIRAGANSTFELQITSRHGIREPLFNLEIEVKAAGTHVQRRFGVLLDPPSYPLAMTPVPEPVTTAPATTPVAAPPAPASPATVASAGSYGPTMPNETLWKIAEKVKPDAAIRTADMIAALHRANPHAFIKGDVNRLKVWEMLRVPTREEILSGSTAPAPVATATVPQPTPAADASEMPAPVEAAATAATPAEGVAVETLAAPAPMATPDLSEATRQSRQRLEALKAEIAALEAASVKRTAEIQALSERVAARASPIAAPRTQTESAAAVEPVVEVAPEVAPIAPTTAEVATVVTTRPGAEVSATTPKPVATDEAGGRLADGMDAVPVLKVLGTALVVIALGAVLHRIGTRRRKSEEFTQWRAKEAELRSAVSEKASQRAQIMEEMKEIVPLWKKRRAKEKAETAAQEAKAASDGVESLLREVDLHLAYQHFDQAEATLKQAIADREQKAEFEIKLADVYLHAGKQAEFLELAQQLHDREDVRNNPAWRRLYAVGKEFFPDRPPFAAVDVEDDRHAGTAQILEFPHKT